MGSEGLTFFTNCMCSPPLLPLRICVCYVCVCTLWCILVWKIATMTHVCEFALCHTGSELGLGFMFQRLAVMLQYEPEEAGHIRGHLSVILVQSAFCVLKCKNTYLKIIICEIVFMNQYWFKFAAPTPQGNGSFKGETLCCTGNDAFYSYSSSNSNMLQIN